MDDSLYIKIKNFNQLFLFYKSFFIIGSIGCIILALIMSSFFSEEKSYINTFLENWQKKPIIDVLFIKHDDKKYSNASNRYHSNESDKINNKVCPENYEMIQLANFPYEILMCDCSNSLFYDLSQGVIKPLKCNKLQYYLGCKDFDQLKYLRLDSWKNKTICIKRHELNYLEINFNKKYEKKIRNNTLLKNKIEIEKNSSLINNISNKNCCSAKDTFYIDLCNVKCPIKNIDLVEKIITNYHFKKDNISKRKKEKLKNSNIFKYSFNRELKDDNFSTYKELEVFYLKNFKIKKNSPFLNNMAISDLIITDTFPCLISDKYKESNTLYSFLNFFLSNFINIKDLEKKIAEILLKGNKTENLNFNEFLKIIKDYSDPIEQEKCYFYQNSYYDRRFFALDKIKYEDFLNYYLYSNSSLMKNVYENNFLSTKISKNYSEKNLEGENISKNQISSLAENLRKNKNKNKDEIDQNYIYLISKPFFGWNKHFCKEDPQKKFEHILKLYLNSSIHIDMMITLKILCFLYILFIVLLQKLKIDYENGFYVGKDNYDRKIFMICDVFYFFLNLMNLFNMIYLSMNIRKINRENYLELIRNSCLDDQSTRLIGYLSDSCEESIIYSILIMTVYSIDILLYCIVSIKSYSIKFNLLNN